MSQVMCPPGSITHTIVAGDTCFALANRYGTTVQAIIAANPGLNCNNLQIGRMICIPGQPVQCPPGTTPYIIRAGDTCFRLAQLAGTTVQAIINANPGLNCNNLQIGQTICIPLGIPGGCPTGTMPYVIKAGDTCWALAQTAGISVQALIAANPGINCNNLQIGQTICIPFGQPTGCPPGTRPHVIVAGDTCYRLAQTYGTTVQAIINANPGINCDNLRIGSTICIP